MPLTSQQLTALPALEWLYHGDRRSGRTLALAVVAVRAACRRPGEWVQVADHHQGTREASRSLFMYVLSLLEAEFGANSYEADYQRLTVRIVNLPRHLRRVDWLPSEEALSVFEPLPDPQEIQRVVNQTFSRSSDLQEMPVYGTSLRERMANMTKAMQSFSDVMKPAPPKPKEEPKSRWERLLEDDGG